MKVIAQEIDNTLVLIETIDDLELVENLHQGRATAVTGIEERINTAYDGFKEVLGSMTKDLTQQVNAIPRAVKPEKISLEFQMGFSLQAGAWIVSGTSECAFKVTLQWDFSKDDAQQ